MKAGIGASAEDLFGEVPKTFVHDGDVKLDGSLEVGGAFTFLTHDAYTVLVITGDFTAAHFQQSGDTQLIVLGKTSVAGYLRLEPSDAGFSAFRGAVTCTDWSQSNTEVESELPTFAKKPKGKQRDAPAQSVEKLHEALAAGRAPFPAEVRATGKKPKVISKAQLAAMTQVEALACRGFVSAQVTEPLNANYFDAFPEELLFLGPKDAERVAGVLRSLPRLTSLKTLRLIDTSLSELPLEISKLSRLEVLEVRGNKHLTGLPAELQHAVPQRRAAPGHRVEDLVGRGDHERRAVGSLLNAVAGVAIQRDLEREHRGRQRADHRVRADHQVLPPRRCCAAT